MLFSQVANHLQSNQWHVYLTSSYCIDLLASSLKRCQPPRRLPQYLLGYQPHLLMMLVALAQISRCPAYMFLLHLGNGFFSLVTWESHPVLRVIMVMIYLISRSHSWKETIQQSLWGIFFKVNDFWRIHAGCCKWFTLPTLLRLYPSMWVHRRQMPYRASNLS